MKKKYKSVLIYSLLFLSTVSSFAQADVNAKRMLAFEAFENEEYEIVTAIIKEIKPQFRSYPLNLLGIEILSAYQIILKEPTKNIHLLDQTRKSIAQYLEDKKSEEDKYYLNVLRAKYKLDTFPSDSISFLAQDEEISDVQFAVIENVPIYPGCENLRNNNERKNCMAEKIDAFVRKRFAIEFVNSLGLGEGRQRISVQFKIDTKGNVVEVSARAPHPELEAETKKIISELPKMTPGTQRGKAVNVVYNLPIIFNIQN